MASLLPRSAPRRPCRQPPAKAALRLAHTHQRFAATEARHTAVQTFATELAKSQAELAEVRSKLGQGTGISSSSN